ncbi:MAG: TetR/AcrR family transcriptional regulator [Myxococcota bacterium]
MAFDAKMRAKKARTEGYREAIIEASEALFSERGSQESKVAEIAAESGISLATLYSVFPGGKAEIIVAIHQTRAAAMVNQAVKTAESPLPPSERLAEGFLTAVRMQVEHANYTRMQLAEGFAWAMPGAVAENIPGGRDFLEKGIDAVAQMIAEGVDAGEFIAEDPAHTARSASLLLQLHLAEWVEGGESESAEEVFNKLWLELRRLLTCEFSP